jgi:hypothetical protein
MDLVVVTSRKSDDWCYLLIGLSPGSPIFLFSARIEKIGDLEDEATSPYW